MPSSFFFFLLGAIGLLFISSAVTMSVPFCMGKIIDIIYTSSQNPAQMVDTLTYVCKILCGVFLLGGTANFGRVYLIQISGKKPKVLFCVSVLTLVSIHQIVVGTLLFSRVTLTTAATLTIK